MFSTLAFNLLQSTMLDARMLQMCYFPDVEGDITALDCGLRSHLHQSDEKYELLRKIIRTLPFGTVLSLRDTLMVDYVFIRGERDGIDFYSIGPFRSLSLEEKDLFALQQKNGLSTAAGEELGALLHAVPCNIMRTEALSAARNILNSFYGVTSPIATERNLDTEAAMQHVVYVPLEDINARARRIEEVYMHQRKLAGFVGEGNTHKALAEAQFFQQSSLERSALDSRTSHRSFLYAANTSFRLTAEGLGIHPVYLDEISRKYAQKLSLALTHAQLDAIYCEMLEDYCRLCREYPTRQYSQNMQRVMNYILFNLSEDLSPENVADAVSFSPGYIARKFKEEAGTTLMGYITEQRIRVAKRLLKSTNMSIREISCYVGVGDWNYFTKVFKKNEGITPMAYRKRLHE